MTLAREYADPMLPRMTGYFGIKFRHGIDVVAFWNCKMLVIISFSTIVVE